MQLIVASLIGVPGSGKTTFSRNLLRMSKENQLNASVLLICFDENIKLDYENLHDGEYKQARETLLKNAENLMTQLIENDQKRWKEVLSSHELKIYENEFHIKIDSPTLIILDDNMFFRSMRRVRNMCKRIDCSHFQIFMKTSLEEALKRNSERFYKIPDSVVNKVFERLEVPINPRTLIIEGELSFHSINLAINDRIKNPETFAEQSEPQVQLKQSIIHEIDIITRRELGKKIKSMMSSKDFSVTCSQLHIKRKDFLEGLKNRKLSYSDSDDNLVEVLRLEFLERLNLSQ